MKTWPSAKLWPQSQVVYWWNTPSVRPWFVLHNCLATSTVVWNICISVNCIIILHLCMMCVHTTTQWCFHTIHTYVPHFVICIILSSNHTLQSMVRISGLMAYVMLVSYHILQISSAKFIIVLGRKLKGDVSSLPASWKKKVCLEILVLANSLSSMYVRTSMMNCHCIGIMNVACFSICEIKEFWIADTWNLKPF